MVSNSPFPNFTKEQFQIWGKLGGRPRLYANYNQNKNAYRLRKIKERLNLLRAAELKKPIAERIILILNPKTNRIIKFNQRKKTKPIIKFDKTPLR